MNVKPWAYHWTQERNIPQILEKGLLPSGGRYGQGVYLSSDPVQLLGVPIYNTLLGVHLRGLERHLFAIPDKK